MVPTWRAGYPLHIDYSQPNLLNHPVAPLSFRHMQALYRGNGANVARLIPDVAFKFAVHDQFRMMFAPQDGSPPGVQEKMAAGAATGKALRSQLDCWHIWLA
jgi:hypothetical protein